MANTVKLVQHIDPNLTLILFCAFPSFKAPLLLKIFYYSLLYSCPSEFVSKLFTEISCNKAENERRL